MITILAVVLLSIVVVLLLTAYIIYQISDVLHGVEMKDRDDNKNG